VNAATGVAVPFFDAAKMQAAFAALPGVSSDDARQLANRGNYNLNPAETAVLINWSNDLFYYELGSDRAVRLTSNPEEEVGEGFSPDGKMVSFVRENNLYVEDLSMQRREQWASRLGLSGRALRPWKLWCVLVESRFNHDCLSEIR
jgi:dipeptidyl-peptidase-4